MRVRTRLARLVVIGVATAAVVLPASGARAIDAGILSGAASPSWQTNDVVLALAAGNGVVYVGGLFTSVRPPGAAPGTGEAPRFGVAAFNANTGDLLTSWKADVKSTSTVPMEVDGLSLSPDNGTLYISGRFTEVNGVARTDIAAVSAATGALTSWAPRIPGTVHAVTQVSNGTVYIGGQFAYINGVATNNAAAISAAGNGSGPPLPWAPDVSGGPVRAINLSPDGSVVVLGGSFDTVNGVTHVGIMGVDPTSGANLAAWGNGPLLSLDFQVYHQMLVGNEVYISAVDFGGQYNHVEFDGSAKLKWADGAVVWADYCQGDTHGIAVVGGTVYAGGHGHDCSKVANGYPVLATHQGLYALDSGDGHMLRWFPKSNSSASTEQTGIRVLATDGTHLFAGGDFTRINDQPQQGFVRFSPGPPDVTPPVLPAIPPVAQTLANGLGVAVRQSASFDPDDGTLTYSLYRDGGLLPVASATVASQFWAEPTVTLIDSSPPAGSHTYTVWVSDGTSANTVSAVAIPVARSHDYSADQRADVLARDSSGNLYRYSGNGTGAFSGRTTVGVGFGSFTALASAGNFAGSVYNDLFARDSSGNLRLYPGNGPGFGAATTPGHGGWG
ncbi:MAG: hypothetical protein ABJA34_01855, partial [Pseudonocardiales bacterium]